MRIVITKDGKLLIQELEEESPSHIRSQIKSFHSSSYSKLPLIYTNEDLIKMYSTKNKNNEFIKTLIRYKEISKKKRSNSLVNRIDLDNFFNKNDSNMNKMEFNQPKKVQLSQYKINISQAFLNRYDDFDESYRKKLDELNDILIKKPKKTEEKEKDNFNNSNNQEIKSDINNNSNNSNINSSNNHNYPDSNNNWIYNNNSSTYSFNNIKRINLGDIISKNNLTNLRNKMTKYNKGSKDVRVPLDKQNLLSYNFRSKYEKKQDTEDDMDLILNYGIHPDKSGIIKYFQQKKRISPQYFENLLKYDENHLYKLNKICQSIYEKNEKEKNKKNSKFFEINENNKMNKLEHSGNLKDVGNLILKSDSIINDYSANQKSKEYLRIKSFKEEVASYQKKYWDRFHVDRFLKNKQKNALLARKFPFTTKIRNPILFPNKSSPNLL